MANFGSSPLAPALATYGGTTVESRRTIQQRSSDQARNSLATQVGLTKADDVIGEIEHLQRI